MTNFCHTQLPRIGRWNHRAVFLTGPSHAMSSLFFVEPFAQFAPGVANMAGVLVQRRTRHSQRVHLLAGLALVLRRQ